MKLLLRFLALVLAIFAAAITYSWHARHRQEEISQAISKVDLVSARAGFRTRLVANTLAPVGRADEPPANLFKVVHYEAPVGALVAYVTPDPHDGRRHPAVVWAHGGYGGIGSNFWEVQPVANDQSARAFREAGIVLLTPSWRGENDNPGRFEMFYGEVEDLHAARAYLSQLPYVDPARIYVAGHSTGGTMTLLANELHSGFRAAFSIGGIPDLKLRLAAGTTAAAPPFDRNDDRELHLRSPLAFTPYLTSPTFYFEGVEAFYFEPQFRLMERIAASSGRRFQAFGVPLADHYSTVLPITRMIAQKILHDDKPQVDISISDDDIADAIRNLRYR